MKKRKHFQGGSSDRFEDDDFLMIAQVAEHAIIRWVLELSDDLDVPISDLAALRKRLKDFLDEEVY